ncbi:hypothetical protein WDU94_011401 [Cyamophila willieti]
MEHYPSDCIYSLSEIDLRDITRSLVEISSKLCRITDVKSTFHHIVRMLELDMKLNEKSVRDLVSMGYDIQTSKVALTLKKNNIMDAVEWLSTEGASIPEEDKKEWMELKLNYETVEITEENFTEHLMHITRYLNKLEELNLKVSDFFVSIIMELGFQDQNQVRQALRKSQNEPNRACLYLLKAERNNKNDTNNDLAPRQVVNTNEANTDFETREMVTPNGINNDLESRQMVTPNGINNDRKNEVLPREMAKNDNTNNLLASKKTTKSDINNDSLSDTLLDSILQNSDLLSALSQPNMLFTLIHLLDCSDGSHALKYVSRTKKLFMHMFETIATEKQRINPFMSMDHWGYEYGR